MTTTFGLTEDGFIARSMEDISAGMAARLRGRFGPNIGTDAASVEGIVIQVVAELATQLWEAGSDIYSSQDPDSNTGQAQDQVAALTGTFRDPARSSVVTETFIGDTGTLVPDQTAVTSLGVTPPTFASQGDATIIAAEAWLPSTAYAIGAFVANDGDADGTTSIYWCTTAGVSAATLGPGGGAADITDGTVHWRWLGDGDGFVQAVCKCTITGPIGAATFSLTEQANPTAGVNNVINLEDAALGSDVMSNTALRIFREDELAKPGTGTFDAMIADLFENGGATDFPVTAVTIFNNVEDFADDGVAPHTFEALIEGGNDQQIRDVILKNRPLGIGTSGAIVGNAADSAGNTNVIRFTRPETVPIAIFANVKKTPKVFPNDGVSQLKSAIYNWGFFILSGYDVEPSAVLGQITGGGTIGGAVAGVLGADLPLLAIYPATPVASTPIVITKRQKATFDTAHIAITTTDATP